MKCGVTIRSNKSDPPVTFLPIRQGSSGAYQPVAGIVKVIRDATQHGSVMV